MKEQNIPLSVRKTIQFFEKNDLWYVLSRNSESRSCKDAVQKRYRIGNTGIPLYDELKSFFGKYDYQNETKYIVVHCRADQDLDWGKIDKVLNISDGITRLTEEEMMGYFGLEYGTVNPFALDSEFIMLPVLQLFDESVLVSKFPPYTMMTNAGDLTWGIEFKPNELISVLKKTIIGDISENMSYVQIKEKHKVGIITGNAPDSGIKLWQDFNKGVRYKLGKSFSGDLSYPNVITHSIPEMGLSMELGNRSEQTWNHINNAIDDLLDLECTIIALACNTTQYFKNRIEEKLKLHTTALISMAPSLEDFLDDSGITEFDFLGIDYVSDFMKWSAFKNLNEKYKVHVPSKSVLSEINNLAFLVKQESISGKGINKLRDLINQSTKTNTVVIALTEISILMSAQKEKSKKGKIYLDTLEIQANAMVDHFMSI